MKKIAISILNRVFSESVFLLLKQMGHFAPVILPSLPPDVILIECCSVQPEILLLDVTPALVETQLESRLQLVEKVRLELPACKIVLLCDEVAYPELAQEVMRTKQVGRIDGFFYTSVSGEYLKAALDAL